MASRHMLEPGKSLRHRDLESAETHPVIVAPDVFFRTSGRSLRDYGFILLKGKWVILSALIVAVTVVALVTAKMTPMYESVARIAVNREDTEMLGFKEIGASQVEESDYTVALETQSQILQGDELLLQVIGTLHLDRNEAFAPKAVLERTRGAKSNNPLARDEFSPADEADLLRVFRKNLSVRRVPKARLIEVRYFSSDPDLAAEVVNTLSRLYLERNFKLKYEAATQTSEWLAQQLADLQMKVESSQEKLVQYQKENEILGIDEKQNITMSTLNEINQQFTLAQTERIQKQSVYQAFRSGNADSLPEVSRNQLVQKLREQEAVLVSERAQARTMWGPSYPKVMELDNQISQVRHVIDAELAKIGQRTETEYTSALTREDMLRTALERQKQEANRLNERAIQYSILKREVEVNRALHEGLLQKMREAGISAGLRASNIRIVERGRVQAKPVKPRFATNIILASLLGLALGISLVFLMDNLDNTVHGPDHIKALTSLPSFGIIPQFTKNGSGNSATQLESPQRTRSSDPLVVATDPHSEMAEAFRALRTSILLSTPEAPPKVILFTSALPQEGKTTVSANMAAVLAQRGSRVLVIDADLRRPGLTRIFGISGRIGISSVLTGRVSAEEVLVPAPRVPNLYIMPAGPLPPFPAELLGSSAMSKLLLHLRSQFDHIVIDSPPVLAVTDPVLLAMDCDAITVVVRAAQTPRESLRIACEQLLQACSRPLGIVVNGFNVKNNSYYGYAYHYGEYRDKETLAALVDENVIQAEVEK